MDVEPEVAFRSGQKQKEKMKKLQLAIVAASLAAAMSASASVTISGSEFNTASVASYNGAYNPAGAGGAGAMNLAYFSPDVDAVVGVVGPLGTLNSLNMSFDYSNPSGGVGNVPFAAFGVSVDGLWGGGSAYEYDIISLNGNQIIGTSLVHVWDFTLNGGAGGDVLGLSGVTLDYVLSQPDNYNGVDYGDLEAMRAYAYIGDSGGTSGSVEIDSITVTTVPEPSTIIAGALALLPFGASTLRILRKKIAA